MSLSNPAAANLATRPAPQPRRRWRRWALLALVLLAAVGFVCRGPLLRAPARWLVVDDPLQPADAVLLFSGDGGLSEAARLYHEGWAARVLLLEGRHRRLERLKIVPTAVEITRRELEKLGIPPERVEVIDCQDAEGWDAYRRLGAWLAARPGARVTALANQLSTRDLHCRLHATLPRGDWDRVRLRPLTHRWYDESNWWRRKEGLLTVFHQYLGLGYDALLGEDREPWREWDPETYKQALRSTR